MSVSIALIAPSAGAPLEVSAIERREVGPHDVAIDIKFAGICHSDIHQAREEWGRAIFPMVPGHEIAGVVTEVGEEVTRVVVGDRVGVGCMVDSCGDCEFCNRDLEQHCARGETVYTYNSRFADGTVTYGGYSDSIVVTERFVVPIPEGIGLDVAAPLLCAGITTYSPLRRWGVGAGSRVAVVGLGGLGHMAVKIAAAMDAEVTVVSRSRAKDEDAFELGAAAYIASEDLETLRSVASMFDVIINTVSADIDIDPYIRALKPLGVLVNVGLPPSPYQIPPSRLISHSKVVAGSNIGGIRETAEMLAFCAEHGIGATIEMISASEVNAAYDRVVDGDVHYRAVIDIATLSG